MADSPDLAPDEKLCPFCAETIKKAAIRCRYCHSDLAVAPDRVPEESRRDPSRRAEPSPPAEPAASLEDSPEEQPPAEVPRDEEPPPPVEPVEAVSSDRTPLLSSLRLMIGLLVLCLVLGGVAAYAYFAENDSGSEADGAITSASARASGLEAATTLTEKVLSYKWSTLAQNVKDSEAVLAPSFRAEYAKTMASVHDQTIKNQVTLTAKAAATSIVSATPRKVVALVFVNQTTTAKGTTNQRVDQNRVLVTLTRDGGEWRVSKMSAF